MKRRKGFCRGSCLCICSLAIEEIAEQNGLGKWAMTSETGENSKCKVCLNDSELLGLARDQNQIS